jgi:DNA-binding IclR family transcriptional regulator
MASVGKTINVSKRTLKQLARMHESGISLEDIARELDISTRSTRRLLKLLGYSIEQAA